MSAIGSHKVDLILALPVLLAGFGGVASGTLVSLNERVQARF
ncbi:hypothetical protein [Alsobacter soli]|nr:hypothetical protein [Alsobacter soli]